MPKADIIHTNAETIANYGLCGYKNPKNESFRRKTEWTRARFEDGMRYNILFSEKSFPITRSAKGDSQILWIRFFE